MSNDLATKTNPFIASRKIGLANPRKNRQPVLN